jgi:hypothetical protein
MSTAADTDARDAEIDSVSDWSSSDNEDKTAAGTQCSVTYKGTTYVGPSVETAADVPSDVATFSTAAGVAMWCRDVGDGTMLALTRNECRRLVHDVLGKNVQAGSASDSDIAACTLAFGTPFPFQLTADRATAAPVASGGVVFRYGKNKVTGEIVALTGTVPKGMSAAKASKAVYWLTTAGGDGTVAMTVTEARRALKDIIGRPLAADAPTPEDEADCVEACGCGCPVQLYDAKSRNERAKLRRVGKTTVPAKDTDKAKAKAKGKAKGKDKDKGRAEADVEPEADIEAAAAAADEDEDEVGVGVLPSQSEGAAASPPCAVKREAVDDVSPSAKRAASDATLTLTVTGSAGTLLSIVQCLV